MSAFFEIMIVNLAVSCDNIGVIALATRYLPEKQAKKASRIGIGLSFLLKLFFIGIIGLLFNIPWLHIRIIGGLLLIYVVHNMLKESSHNVSYSKDNLSRKDSMLFALVSIIATDISMSLDNVIAILSIVSKDSSSIDAQSFLLICCSLVVSIPVLLWCSGMVTKLIDRFPVLTYICAGYLFYTAITMICEDELIVLLLDSINFTITAPFAVLSGFGVSAASIYINRMNSSFPIHTKKRLVRVYIIAAVDALITLGMIGYLSSAPVKHGIQLTVESFFHFTPSGANGLYTIGRSPHLLALCACLIVSIVFSENDYGNLNKKQYLGKLKKCIGTMFLFLMIDVLIATAGLTLIYGFGTLSVVTYLGYLTMQIILYSSYLSIFCMYKVFIKQKSIMIIVSMVTIHIEIELVELFMFLGRWPFFTGYMPGRFVHNIPQPLQTIDSLMLYRILLCAGICIISSTWIGCLGCCLKHNKKDRNR